MEDEAKKQNTSDPSTPVKAVDWVAVREKAEYGLVSGVTGLQNLERISKGAGRPALHELVSLFTNTAVYLSTLPREMTEMGRVLSSLLIQGSLRLDALLNVLIDKGVLTSEEFQAKGREISKAQGEAMAAARAAARAERVMAAADQAETPKT
jgi:hypothetical protein